MGSAPYLGGGFGHFYAYAPIKIEYAIDRFAMEAKRQLDVLDRRLGESEYIAGDDYTIADMAVWPWYGGLVKGWLYGAAEFLRVQDYKNVQRWADAIAAAAGGASAAAWSTGPRATRRASCTSATTRAISRPRRRTRSGRRIQALNGPIPFKARALPQLAGEGGTAKPAGWGVARCFEPGRLARPYERAFDDAYLLSIPHPSGSARHLGRFAEKILCGDGRFGSYDRSVQTRT